ncbi:O-antigen ligase family protein [Pandoraea sp.]|uniref:O-antigen ligase family protein n=1 Tax=Pandoraea sp. TaxID=1883445 RepID=UPI0011F996EC|nr:O-antigen ligase family protein [Pandoraea sp.]TAL54097.1 MAG: O-antigen ligase family protein [Pandoraea sp.]TAM14209.1 MAG: O-antigen ligase family protein [Pandoraea sp.]
MQQPSLPWYRDAVTTARGLLIAQLVFLMFSPPLTNIAEGLLYLLVLLSPTLRQRVKAALRQPMVMGLGLFAAFLIIGMFYGNAPRAEAWSMLTGWRRLLMLPIACAVFDDEQSKRRLLMTFIAVAVACAVVSFALFFAHRPIYHYELGITVRNHATQGLLFSVAAFAAAILLRAELRAGVASRRGVQAALLASVFLLVVNTVFVTSGRSGYLALMVLFAVYLLTLPGLGGRMLAPRRLVLVAVGVAVATAALFMSPIARERIDQGFHEADTYQDASHLTSIGIRIVFLKHTLAIIRANPWFGVGTGGFRVAYQQQVAGKQGWEAVGTNDPHNQFLKIAAEQGLLGLAAFLTFLASAFRQRVDSTFRTLGLGVLCAWCASSLFSSHFSTFSEGRFIFIWLGVTLALPLLRRDRANE